MYRSFSNYFEGAKPLQKNAAKGVGGVFLLTMQWVVARENVSTKNFFVRDFLYHFSFIYVFIDLNISFLKLFKGILSFTPIFSMFYNQLVFAKHGPLSRIWLAAHWDKKLSRRQILDSDIQDAVNQVIRPSVCLLQPQNE